MTSFAIMSCRKKKIFPQDAYCVRYFFLAETGLKRGLQTWEPLASPFHFAYTWVGSLSPPKNISRPKNFVSSFPLFPAHIFPTQYFSPH